VNKNKKTNSKLKIEKEKYSSKEKQKLVGQDQQKVKKEQTKTSGETVSGHMPDPPSDDNVVKSANKVGLYPDAGEGEPPEVDVAKQIEKAEEDRRDEEVDVK
jgi:hypothetical protein